MVLNIINAKNGKKVVFRRIEKNDLMRTKEFVAYINGILEEDDYIHLNEKQSLKKSKTYIEDLYKASRKRETVAIIAESDGQIIGIADIASKKWRENHVAVLGVTLRRDYRGRGIGTHLITTAIEEAKKTLKSKPKIMELEVFKTNVNAKRVYQKLGFKEIAELRDRIQLKGKLVPKILMEKYV